MRIAKVHPNQEEYVRWMGKRAENQCVKYVKGYHVILCQTFCELFRDSRKDKDDSLPSA